MKLIGLLKKGQGLFSSTTNLKILRERSGAPLIKCKEALEKFSSLEEAEKYLREKNLASAAKYIQKQSNEFLYTFRQNESKVQIMQFNTETDFVLRNNDFLNFVDSSSKHMML